jgi:hypothetical protein
VKPSIRKQDGRWLVSRPGYGFCPPTVDEYTSWREAVGSLRSGPGSAGALVERGQDSQGVFNRYWRQRGTIRMEDSMATTGGGHPRSHDGQRHEEPEVGPVTPSGVSSAGESAERVRMEDT